MAAGIYEIVNLVTGSRYVGSAVNIQQRWASHRCALRNHKKAPPKLQRAWDKYGESAFEFRVLVTCLPEHTLMYEQLAIDAVAPKYNTRPVAHSNLGVRWSEETNLKKSRPKSVYTVRGVTGGIGALCRHFGVVSDETARHRLGRGWGEEDAFLTPALSKSDSGKRSVAVKRERGVLPPNTRLFTVRGETGSMTTLAAKFNLPYYAVRSRLQNGWDVDRAFTTPIGVTPRHRSGRANKKSKIITVHGFTGNIREVAGHFGVKYDALVRRLHAGWSPESAVATKRYGKGERA